MKIQAFLEIRMFFYCIEDFDEIPYAIKSPPAGSHCGGGKDC
jgi:hypothetical protein